MFVLRRHSQSLALCSRTAMTITSTKTAAQSAPPSASHGSPFSTQVHVRHAPRQGISGVIATVFGSSGFLGRYVVNNFGRIGSQVVAPYRGDGFNVRHLKVMGDLGQIVPIATNVRNEDELKRCMERSNVVVNLIGLDHPTRNYSFDDVHVGIASKIARVAREIGVAKLVHVSALGAAHDSTSNWMASKARGEDAVRKQFPSATIIRPATMFGIEDHFVNMMANLAQYMPIFPLVNSGDQLMQPVHATDVADAILRVVESPEWEGQTFELAGPEVFSHMQFSDFVFKELHAATNTTVPLPLWLAKLYGRMLQLYPEKYRLLTEDQVMRMQYDNVLSGDRGIKTFEDLDIKPDTFSLIGASLVHRHQADTRMFVANS